MKHNVIVGSGSGKLGNNVFYVRGGVQMARIYQPVVANPRTRAQITQREKFTLLNDTAIRLGCIVQMGLLPWKSGRISQLNKFIQLNKSAVSAGEEIEYDALQVAKGTLTPAGMGTASFTEPMKVRVPIEESNAEACDASADDDVFGGVYCPAKAMAIPPVSVKRTANLLEINVPSSWQGNKVHVWSWTQNAEGKTSDSFYCGSGTIQ